MIRASPPRCKDYFLLSGFSTFPTYLGFEEGSAFGESPLAESAPGGTAALVEGAWPSAPPTESGKTRLSRFLRGRSPCGEGEEAAPSLPDPGPRFSPIYKARPIARPRLVLRFVLHQAQELFFACLDFGALQLLGLEIVRLRRERFTVDLYTAAIDESPCF